MIRTIVFYSPKNLKIPFAISSLWVSFVLTGCASILNPKYQKVEIVVPEKSILMINGQIPNYINGKCLIRRDGIAKQVAIKKEGYKDYYTSIVQCKYSPYHYLSIAPFGVLIFPWVYDSFKKSKNYNNLINLSGSLSKLPDNYIFSKLLRIHNVEANFSEDAFFVRSSIKPKHFQDKNKYRRILKNSLVRNNQPLAYECLSGASAFLSNKYHLKKYNDTDLTKQLVLNATITKLMFNDVQSNFNGAVVEKHYGSFLNAEMEIEWEIVDEKRDVIFKHSTQVTSGEFAYNENESKPTGLINSINDALELGFIQIINNPKTNDLLSKWAEKNLFALYNPDNNKTQYNSSLIMSNVDTISFHLNNFNRMRKKALLKMIKDFPELYNHTSANFRSSPHYNKSVINCYNDFKMNHANNMLLGDKYFKKFGVVTRKQWKTGPTAEDLKDKKEISGNIRHLRSTTTKNYIRSGQATITVADNFRFSFHYGNTEYKPGFLLKNLKKAIGDDAEAIKHIKKYRMNFIARTSIFGLGLIQLVVLYKLIDDTQSFGKHETAAWAFSLPAVITVNWHNCFPQQYKAKNIKNAIDIYNKNLAKKAILK